MLRNHRLTHGNCYGGATHRLGFRKTAVGASAFVLFCFATFLLLRGTACAVPLSQQQKRQLPITLGASLLRLKLFYKILLNNNEKRV